MRTGDVADRANERQLSATLDFGKNGAELLVLNGGARAEEISVETVITSANPRRRRSAYCLDSGTSMHLVFPLLADEDPRHLTVRIMSGAGPITLAPTPGQGFGTKIRASAAVGLAALFLIIGGGKLDPNTNVFGNITVEPLQSELVLLRPTIALAEAGPLPSVKHSAIGVPPNRKPVQAFSPLRLIVQRRVQLATIASPPAPPPRVTNVHVQTTAASGTIVPVSFATVGTKVRIIASIGPTIVSRTEVSGRRGVVAIHSPKSDRLSRVMTIRVYAISGAHSARREATVVLVRPPAN
jgi:hypothetical protein